MPLCGCKFVRGGSIELMFHRGMCIDEIVEPVSWEPAQLGFLESFGRECVLILDTNSKEIPRMHEPDHVTPTVGQQSVQLESSSSDGEDTRRGSP